MQLDGIFNISSRLINKRKSVNHLVKRIKEVKLVVGKLANGAGDVAKSKLSLDQF